MSERLPNKAQQEPRPQDSCISTSYSSLSEKERDTIAKEPSSETQEYLPPENFCDKELSTDGRENAQNDQTGNMAPCQRSHSRSTQHTNGDGGPPLAPRMSMDTQGNIYPEGGREAYMVVFGSFLALFGSLGIVNTLGSIHAWISVHQLKNYNQSSVSWIFGIYAFLLFFGGLQIGPIFDAKGPKLLVLAGTILSVLSVALLGSCTEYWHFMVVYSVIGGIGVSLVFTPAVASPGHFFFRLRGRATGIATTGGSVGGIVFPLMLESLYPKVGFAWATRAVALVCLVAMFFGCLLIKSRLPKKRATKENILPDLRILFEPVFALTTAGIFFIEWGLFIPITYVTSYALAHNMPRALSYQLLALLNVGSFFGRWIPGFISDYLGRFNIMIGTVLLCLLSTTCLWLPAQDSVGMMVAYSLIFGFASGSNISLTPVCVRQVCKTENYGRYYATAYTVVSFGCASPFP
ncbi:hypothetical protein LOY94_003465 [Ophidiomyces ophidiicola]|nr:hypothetical protein LOY94_003465 [Ophidiomyces ophidiicola]